MHIIFWKNKMKKLILIAILLALCLCGCITTRDVFDGLTAPILIP